MGHRWRVPDKEWRAIDDGGRPMDKEWRELDDGRPVLIDHAYELFVIRSHIMLGPVFNGFHS